MTLVFFWKMNKNLNWISLRRYVYTSISIIISKQVLIRSTTYHQCSLLHISRTEGDACGSTFGWHFFVVLHHGLAWNCDRKFQNIMLFLFWCKSSICNKIYLSKLTLVPCTSLYLLRSWQSLAVFYKNNGLSNIELYTKIKLDKLSWYSIVQLLQEFTLEDQLSGIHFYVGCIQPFRFQYCQYYGHIRFRQIFFPQWLVGG